MTKSIFKSKTFWVNAVTILIAIATYFGISPDQALAEKATTFLLAVSPIVNIFLRLVTKQPVVIS